jgi:hypothetical protein
MYQDKKKEFVSIFNLESLKSKEDVIKLKRKILNELTDKE